MNPRDTPYGAFNFTVDLGSGTTGGFSDVSGLVTEMTTADYRNGNEPENHVRKVPGMHKVTDITLKRGLIGSDDLFAWMRETRTAGYKAKRDITVRLLDEAHEKVAITWKLRGVVPLRYTGPTLAGKGGGDVAMEELVLSCEGLEIE
jgi:phage tail-like protein